jgi:hypothetical protein
MRRRLAALVTAALAAGAIAGYAIARAVSGPPPDSPSTTTTTTSAATSSSSRLAPLFAPRYSQLASSTAISGSSFEDSTNAPYTSGLECPNPSTQFARATSPVREGQRAAMFHETAADIWQGNGIVRCLATRYDSGETAGDDYYYHLSVYIPATLQDNLLWELHHPSSLYNVSGCTVAPYAISSRSSGLIFRISTGNCTVGSGYAHWEPNIPIPGLASQPLNTWLDFVVHIRFTEDTTGVVDVYWRKAGDPWPAAPQISRTGIPTLPFCNSCNVHNVKLYWEAGLYAGRTGYSGSDTVYLDDVRRELSLANAEGTTPTPPPPPPPPPPVDKFAAVRAEMAYFKTSSPHIYAAFDQLLKALAQP